MRVVAVSEAALARALLLCLERAKQVVEPSGAAGVAALLEGLGDVEPPVVVVLSGGNIDPLLLSKLLRHGLSAAGRFLGFRCRVPDYPGSLAALLALLADLGANVLEVSHERLAPTLRVDEVEVVLQVETRGPEHCAARQGHAPHRGVRPGVQLARAGLRRWSGRWRTPGRSRGARPGPAGTAAPRPAPPRARPS